MALTFAELEKIMAPQAGAIRVAGGQLQTPAVEALFQNFFAEGVLNLSSATSTSDGAKQQVTVTGTLMPGTFLNLRSATVQAGTWTLQGDGTVTVLLQIRVNDEKWSPAQSFDVLRGSVFEETRFSGAVFTLDSTAHDVLPPNFRQSFGFEKDLPQVAERMVKGLSLAAGVGFAGEIEEELNILFETPIMVQGPVEVYFVSDPESKVIRPFPQFLLNAAGPGLSKTIGSYTFSFNLQAACIFQEFRDDKSGEVAVIPTGVLAVRTNFTPPNTPAIPISVFLFGGSGGRLLFNVGNPPRSSIKKDQLSGLLNGINIGSLLNPGEGFPGFDLVTLESASLAIALQPLALERITVDVALGAGKDWQLFDGLVTIRNIGFRVTVSNAGGTFTPGAEIFASAFLARNEKIQLSGYVSLPDLTFSCELVETVPIDLTSAVKDLIGEAINLPTISGSTFQISGNVKQSTYTLEGLIEQHWTILGTAQKGLTLENIYLKLGYRKGSGEGQSKISGSVFAELGLAGARILLMAGYESGGGWTFAGQTAPGQAINLTRLLAEVAALFDITIPPGLPEIDLDQLSIEYNTLSGDLNIAAAVRAPAASFTLTDLPLVGKHIDPAYKVSLETVTITVSKTAEGTTSQLIIAVNLGGKDRKQIVIPLSGKPKPKALLIAAGETHAETSALALVTDSPLGAQGGAGYWIPIQRTFGPIEIEKIGFTLHKGGLGIQINAGLALSVLTIEVLGLEMTVPLRAPYTPAFDIHGLNVSYKGGAVMISGGLVKVDAPYLRFDGYLIVRAGTFMLGAFGSFATTSPPSLFFFAMINAPIGGVPEFFVTGLAGGFGYNRDLKLPTMDDLPSFPLVAGASAGASNPFGANPSFDKYLEVMQSSMGVSIGENWLAAGINFTTYETLSSYALLTVSFGRSLQIGLLGLSTLSIPPMAPEPVAKAQLALAAVFSPSSGELALSAQLTPESYVLSRTCRLTGGFAFYIWFYPSLHAGDFVITLGGYNPYFVQPDYYPVVPRLGAAWTLKDSPIVIKGGMYLAFTPHSIMVGGSLEATWESGGIKAWFTMHADFLVRWKPFHYDARAGVNFGVTATLNVSMVAVTISVSVGAELHLWGPEFQGEAELNLNVISIKIPIGAAKPEPPPKPIDWKEFKESFLPPPPKSAFAPGGNGATQSHSLLKASIQDGLLKDLTRDDTAPVDYVVDPQRFAVLIQSLIPAKGGTFNGKPLAGTWNGDFGIGPMELAKEPFTSEYRIRVQHDGKDLDRLEVTPVRRAVPKALWVYEADLYASLNKPALLEGVAQGVRIVPAVDTPDHSLPIRVAALLYADELSRKWQWGNNVAPGSDPFGGDDPWTKLTQTIDDEGVAVKRNAIVADLFANGFGVSPLIDTAPLTYRNTLNMLDPVVLSYLGEGKSKGATQA